MLLRFVPAAGRPVVLALFVLASFPQSAAAHLQVNPGATGVLQSCAAGKVQKLWHPDGSVYWDLAAAKARLAVELQNMYNQYSASDPHAVGRIDENNYYGNCGGVQGGVWSSGNGAALPHTIGYFRGNAPISCDCWVAYAGDMTSLETSNVGESQACPEGRGPEMSCLVGDPINAATGNSIQREVDYRGTGAFPLTFVRTYNSADLRETVLGRGRVHGYSRALRKDFGASVNGAVETTPWFTSQKDACEQGWSQARSRVFHLASTTATYSNGVCKIHDGGTLLADGSNVRATMPIGNVLGSGTLQGIYAQRADGRTYRFAGSSTFTGPSNVSAKLVQTANGYRLTDNDVVEEYDTNGRLLSISNRAGVTQTMGYANGKLTSVTDSFARSLQFEYDGSGHLSKLIDPDGKEYVYGYNNTTNVATSVQFPDNTTRTYHYEDPVFVHGLTGVTDQNNNRYATWAYDSQRRAKSSVLAGGVEQVDITFNADRTAVVKDAVNTERTYTFQEKNGVYKPISRSQPCLPSCGAATESSTYDGNGYLQSRTDFNGNVTTFTFNTRGLETSRTEAYGTSLARTITTQWHATYRLPTQIDEPGRRTTFTHDGSGNVLTRTVLDTATNGSRTTTWTYNSLGQVLTVDGPRTDVSDVTAYAYFGTANAYHRVGDLHTITNALGQVTEITEYDAHGNPKAITDPNGVVTTLTYDLRQRLKTRTVAGVTTNFDYDGVGQLTKVTLPGGAYLQYTYDAAHRLTDIQDNAGNKIHYALDLLGNRTGEEVRDPANNLKRAQSQVFDALGRLQQIKDAGSNVVTEFGYDKQGNRTSQLDAGTYGTSFTPDGLNRIGQVTDAANGVTQYGYNALDQLTSVIDPKNLATTYTINALGNVTQQASPDSGTTNYTFDAAGNRLTQTDARGVLVTYSYDKLNRLTFVDYDGSASEDVTYTYDSTANGNYGVGRLTGTSTDESGSTALTYDMWGNVTKEQHTIDGTTYTTSYTYDDADRLTSITYPTGRLVSYERNSLGQVSKVTTKPTASSSEQTLAEDIAYMPFGGIKGYTLGNGVAVTRTFDTDYRLSEIKDQGSSTLQNLKLHYDLRGNIEQREDLLSAAKTQDFSVDALSRLVSADGFYGLQGFTYDAVGNRESMAVTPVGGSATTDTYTYQTTPVARHRLTSQTSGPSYTYDGAGNATSNGTLDMTYNQANRLATVTGGSAAVTNVYSANGQRVKKTAGGVTTVFHYGQGGRLLAERTDAGLFVGREYVWLGDIPLAVASDRTIPDFFVDNADGSFSTTGGWSTASASGQYGSSYAKRGPAVEVPGQWVVDDSDAATSSSGTWLEGQNTCSFLCPPLLNTINPSEAPYGSTYHRSADTPGSSESPVFTWTVALPGAGHYQAYVRWVPVGGAGHVTYAVTHAAGTASFPIDQAISSGGWYALGKYEFGTGATITLTPDSGVTAVADAVRLVPIEEVDNDIATWLPSGEVGKYEVFGRWPSVSGASSAAPFSVVHAGGTASSNQDQTANAGIWNSFGEFTFDASGQGVKLNAVWDDTVLADAIHFVPVAEYAHRYNLAYFHVDHLGTPQKMTDATQQIVWDATYEPFGGATVTKQAFYDNPLRFPGQYFDAETGLHQNWMRDYDPALGRYLQSDPVGLAAGLSTYGYVRQNPARRTDRWGLSDSPVDFFGSLILPNPASGPASAALPSDLGQLQYMEPQTCDSDPMCRNLGQELIFIETELTTVLAGLPLECAAVKVASFLIKDERVLQKVCLAAGLSVSFCQGFVDPQSPNAPPDELFSDLQRRGEMRKDSERASQRRLGEQEQRP